VKHNYTYKLGRYDLISANMLLLEYGTIFCKNLFNDTLAYVLSMEIIHGYIDYADRASY
jgi:hypothetical protein